MRYFQKTRYSMKHLLSLLLLLPATAATFAQKTPAAKPAAAANGYEIKVTLKPFKNEWIYLGHYYGKQLPILYSVKLNSQSEGVFKGSKKLGGGTSVNCGNPECNGRTPVQCGPCIKS